MRGREEGLCKDAAGSFDRGGKSEVRQRDERCWKKHEIKNELRSRKLNRGQGCLGK